jgi:hypothetical protein
LKRIKPLIRVLIIIPSLLYSQGETILS